ncbi:MAG: metallophosphoesterase, partial [Thermodesulfobacteriota bacterium]|nr:metallophosphoesterase [Thermodesulfobacteriota bacterium]
FTMPYYCLPGDNDIIDGEGGIERYREQLGDDYYAFDYGRLNFIGLNNNFYLSLDEAQRQWLEAELNEEKTEMIFAHRPLVNHENGEPITGSETLLGLLETHSVAIHMNGHEHLSAVHTRNGTHHVWCDNLSYFHSGEETYNLYEVYSDHVLLYHIYFDGSQVPAGSFPITIEIPDLVVTDKIEECIDLDEGTYLVHYRVQNIGNGAAGESAACLYIDGVRIEEADQTIGSLAAGEESDIFTFNYAAAFTPPVDTVGVCIDCPDDIAENDETNNCMENVWAGNPILFDIHNGAGEPGAIDRKVELGLANAVAVSGIQVDIYDEDDCLTLTGVEPTNRASGFTCDFEDDYAGTGCARVILYSAGGSFIPPGNNSILSLRYDVKEGSPLRKCRSITPENLLITDENNDPLSAAQGSGSFYFGVFGDLWPYDSVSGAVGDGLVNIFDVVRDIQILLETYTPSVCEFVSGNVPTGDPPYCQAPDEVINVQDILIIVARILERQNCIESYGSPFFDEEQVQVVTSVNDFAPFSYPPPEIIYGPYSMRVTPYTAVIAWEERKWNDELRHVDVHVSGLSPATPYLYRVNGSEKDGRFLTSPVDNSPFSFLVWGDSRTGSEMAIQVADKMIEADPNASFAIHTGDIVIDGNRLEYWESEWWGPMSGFMLHLPIYPTVGNHEADSPFYYRYFSALGGDGRDYSFDWDGCHFLVFDSNAENFGSDEQMEWIISDLQQNQDTNFTVVTHHLPVYVSSTAGGSGSEDLQDILVPIYDQYGVDLVFNGDVHTYQHHLKKDIHYLVTAGGGTTLYDYGLPLEGMTMKLFKTYHFCNVQVNGESMRVMAYDLDGNILDDFKLISGKPVEARSRIVLETSSSEVMPGEQFSVDLFVGEVENLEEVYFTMACYKDNPPIVLEVVDADPVTAGVQIDVGDLGGNVSVNLADNDLGIIEYREEGIGGIDSDLIKTASITFFVPGDAPVTAVYLVPKFFLFDSYGEEILHFMGGVKVAITQ